MTSKHSFLLLLSFFFILCSCQDKANSSHSHENATIAKVEIDIAAELGEGAIWNDQRQELWWIDIEGKKLHCYNPQNSLNKTYDLRQRIGTVVPDKNGKAIIALQSGIYSFDLNTEQKVLLSNPITDNAQIRYNDGKCDPQGRFWVGSMHLNQIKAEADLYCIEKNKATLKIDSVTISNGICWSKDQKTMFYIDTPSGEIKAYDFNPENGAISNKRIAITIPESDGFPDGMTIDENDHLWVGLWNGNAVAQYDPFKGKLIKKHPIPAHNISSCAFGGKNLDILYVTSARVDMTDEELKKHPKSGSVFSFKPGVKGVASNYYIGQE